MLTRPMPPYRISRDLVKSGYLFRLMLHNVELAHLVTALPFPPAWMVDRRDNGNSAAMLCENIASSATTLTGRSVSKATKGECRAAR